MRFCKMEKYSIFTEKTNGVNPFTLPPYRPSLCPGLLLALLRAAPLLILLPLLFLLELLVFQVEACSLALGSVARQVACRPLAHCVLFFLGVRTELSEARKEGLPRPPESHPGGATAPSAGGGVLYLVNSCSYLDALVLLALKGSALGVLSAKGRVVRCTLLGAFLRGFQRGSVAQRALPVEGAAGNALAPLGARGASWAVLSLQPEGAPTNGRALLRLSGQGACEGLEGLARAASAGGAPPPLPALRLLALHYGCSGDGGKFSPCFLGAASPWWHALCLLTHWGSTVAACTLPAGYDPLPMGAAEGDEARSAAAWGAQIVALWEHLLRRFNVRAVGSTREDYARYIGMAQGAGGAA